MFPARKQTMAKKVCFRTGTLGGRFLRRKFVSGGRDKRSRRKFVSAKKGFCHKVSFSAQNKRFLGESVCSPHPWLRQMYGSATPSAPPHLRLCHTNGSTTPTAPPNVRLCHKLQRLHQNYGSAKTVLREWAVVCCCCLLLLLLLLLLWLLLLLLFCLFVVVFVVRCLLFVRCNAFVSAPVLASHVPVTDVCACATKTAAVVHTFYSAFNFTTQTLQWQGLHVSCISVRPANKLSFLVLKFWCPDTSTRDHRKFFWRQWLPMFYNFSLLQPSSFVADLCAMQTEYGAVLGAKVSYWTPNSSEARPLLHWTFFILILFGLFVCLLDLCTAFARGMFSHCPRRPCGRLCATWWRHLGDLRRTHALGQFRTEVPALHLLWQPRAHPLRRKHKSLRPYQRLNKKTMKHRMRQKQQIQRRLVTSTSCLWLSMTRWRKTSSKPQAWALAALWFFPQQKTRNLVQ